MEHPLRLIPLGGLGEIGMNCMAMQYGDDLIVIDCGIMFGEKELGVDIIHPDFSWITARKSQFRGLVITHGHEDHIGAAAFLMKLIKVPIYGPSYALRLMKKRLSEYDLDQTVTLNPTEPRKPYKLGAFEIEPYRVTHSIPDCHGIVIRTPIGNIVHTGDFKLDPNPPDGQKTDEDFLRQTGEQGVRLLMSDSTNIDRITPTGNENDAAIGLEEIIRNARFRVVVGLFASNVHRLKAIIELAKETNRKICLLGRSLQVHFQTAVEAKLIDPPYSLMVAPDKSWKVPRNELLIIATGTQGESIAALSRIAEDSHPNVSLDPDDMVILSSRVIPGHEQVVNQMTNQLERRGMEVRTRITDPNIHVSGHASRPEQAQIMEWTKPQAFIPVHGTYHHLRRHARLANEHGIEDTLVIENGALVEIDKTSMKVTSQTEIPRVHVDAGDTVPDVVIRDRALMAEVGIALVVVHTNGKGELVDLPNVMTRGVIDDESEPELLERAKHYVAEELKSIDFSESGFDAEILRETARRSLKRFLRKTLRRKPLTYGMIVQTK